MEQPFWQLPPSRITRVGSSRPPCGGIQTTAAQRPKGSSSSSHRRERGGNRVYPDLSHANDWEAAIAATSFVSDAVIGELCDALALVGPAEHCANRIVEMTKLGVRNLYLMAFQTSAPPETEIVALRDVVFGRLAAAGLR